jgi:hypothetical protein
VVHPTIERTNAKWSSCFALLHDGKSEEHKGDSEGGVLGSGK